MKNRPRKPRVAKKTAANPLVMEAARNELHHGVRLLVVGVVTGISVTVLYQNITGLHAGRIQPAQPSAVPTVALAQLPPAQASTLQPSGGPLTALLPPASADAGQPAAAPAPPLRMLDVPALPVLPAPRPGKSAAATLLAPAPASKSEPSGVSIERIQPIAQDDDDDGTGVHVQLRTRAGKTPAAQELEAKADQQPGIEVPSLGKPPAPKTAAQRSLEPSPQPLKPQPDQAQKLPASPQPSTAQNKDQDTRQQPAFTIVRQGGDGVLIRIGNQVRHLPAGSALPDGSPVSPAGHQQEQP